MTATLLTNAEFELLPEYDGKQELIEGELIELPPARNSHSRISFRLTMLLRQQLGERARIETGYQLTTNSRT
jgi:Uma2 family endonuclease